MDADDILKAVNAGEDADWEFKSAQGGLPRALWESYSAMANTDGGVIVLGVEPKGPPHPVTGLKDPAVIRGNFWNTINDRGKVSANILRNEDVTVETVDTKPVLVIRVPRATRRQRPVYVGQNPLDGTYRRNFEGDYLCQRDEVGRMLGDQSEESLDARVLEHFTLADLDAPTLRQYRNRFASRDAAHPWLSLDDQPLLESLGGWRRDRARGVEGLTVAGLLMFGQERAIQDELAVPQYAVDYRERYSDDPAVRWTDRVWQDGKWVANLFQFFERVYPKLVADLKIPFQFAPALRGMATTTTTLAPEGMLRRDETLVHEAIREAFVNSLIHADYQGQGGIIIEKYRDRLEFSNPGTLLLGVEQVFQGNVSECRNKSLQKMFAMLGYGEKAGSGFPKIRQGWASQQWRSPRIEEASRPDRVKLTLLMISLLPPEVEVRLSARFGERFATLTPLEIQTLATAEIEGVVSNPRMRMVCDHHPADLTKMLQGLVSKGFLVRDGQGRWTTYLLPASTHKGPDSSHNGGDSTHKGPDSSHNEDDSSHYSGEVVPLPPLDENHLIKLAEPYRAKDRRKPDETRQIILTLCEGRSLSAAQLARLLDRDQVKLRERFLTPMVESGRLRLRHPDEPTHPQQGYTTARSPEARP